MIFLELALVVYLAGVGAAFGVMVAKYPPRGSVVGLLFCSWIAFGFLLAGLMPALVTKCWRCGADRLDLVDWERDGETKVKICRECEGVVKAGARDFWDRNKVTLGDRDL